MTVKTKFAISAFIDLLGFSNHLTLANNDTRTVIGEMAVKRLLNLEEILRIIEEEEKQLKVCYPSVEIHRVRFNDAIFLTMELSEVIQTEVGNNIWSSSRTSDLKEWKAGQSNFRFEKLSVAGKGELTRQSRNVAKFLGLIARVHSTINIMEKKENFPGVRTVVSTGLKVNSKGLDAFSANFALSNAFIVGESGSKAGFGGNNLYVDDNVANIISIDKNHYNLLCYSNLIMFSQPTDPYDYESRIEDEDRRLKIFREFKKSTPITAELFGKTYSFRALNAKPLTWIPVQYYLESLKIKNPTGYLKTIMEGFKMSPPSVHEIKGKGLLNHPFLATTIPLTKDVIQNNFNQDAISKAVE